MDTRHTIQKRMKRHQALTKTIRQWCSVIALCVGLAYIIPPSQAAQEKSNIEQAFKIFNQINVIALQRDTLLDKQFKDYNQSRDQEFLQEENDFTTTQDVQQKFEEAKELNIMIQVQDKFLHDEWYTNIDEEVVFNQLESEFNSTK